MQTFVFTDLHVMCLFYFSHFELEYEENCDYDSLCVYGVKFCGSWPTGQIHHYFFPAYSTFTVVFRTDYSDVLSGFKVNCMKSSMQCLVVTKFIFKITYVMIIFFLYHEDWRNRKADEIGWFRKAKALFISDKGEKDEAVC